VPGKIANEIQSVQEIWALYLVLCTCGLFVSRMAFWIMSCWACPKLGVRIIEEIYLHLILQILDVIYRSFQHCHYINLLPNHEYFRRADWQTTGWTVKLVPASSDLTQKKFEIDCSCLLIKIMRIFETISNKFSAGYQLTGSPQSWLTRIWA
jgi:hypothetical protein